jgi:hypothetical protein
VLISHRPKSSFSELSRRSHDTKTPLRNNRITIQVRSYLQRPSRLLRIERRTHFISSRAELKLSCDATRTKLNSFFLNTVGSSSPMQDQDAPQVLSCSLPAPEVMKVETTRDSSSLGVHHLSAHSFASSACRVHANQTCATRLGPSSACRVHTNSNPRGKAKALFNLRY